MIRVARDYCARVSGAFFLLRRYPRPHLATVLQGGSEVGIIDIDQEELVPAMLNWYLFAAHAGKNTSLRVSFKESDGDLEFVGFRTLEVNLFNTRDKRDVEFGELWRRQANAPPTAKAGPFRSRKDMEPGLRNYYGKMMQLVSCTGETPGESVARQAYALLWGEVTQPGGGAVSLGLEHPLVEFQLYCAFELLGLYTGWDSRLIESNWSDFWFGNRPRILPKKNRSWNTLKKAASGLLNDYMVRVDPNDLLVRLFDYVVSDRVRSNFVFPYHLGGKETLLHSTAAARLKHSGSLRMAAGRPFGEHDIASRRHIPAVRLAEKIMHVLQMEGGKLPVAIVGDVHAQDISELWALIGNPEALLVPDMKNEFAKDNLSLTFYTSSGVTIDQVNLAEELKAKDKTDIRPANSIYDVDYKACRLIFMLDCDGLYEDREVLRSEEFDYLLAHPNNALNGQGCEAPYADGLHPEATSFGRAWLFLDSLAYAGTGRPDTFRKRMVSPKRLDSIRKRLNGGGCEVYIYVSGGPDDSDPAFYIDDGLRICRQETFGCSTVTLLRVANTPGERVVRESSTVLAVPLWQLFKSFDSHFCEWIGGTELPPFVNALTVRDVLKEIKEDADPSEWVKVLKNVHLSLDYEKFFTEKKVTYHFEFGKDIVAGKYHGNALNHTKELEKDALRLECYLKKMAADFFLVLQNKWAPDEKNEIFAFLRKRCKRVLSNCILGSSKTVADLLFYYAIDRNGSFIRDLQWVYDEDGKAENAYEKEDKNHEFACHNYVDRTYFVQLMRVFDAPMFTPGSERFTNQLPLANLSAAAKAVHDACTALEYTYSPMYEVSKRFF